MNRISKTINQTLPARLLQRVSRALPLSRRQDAVPRSTSTLMENAYEAVVTGVRRETSRAVTVEFELFVGCCRCNGVCERAGRMHHRVNTHSMKYDEHASMHLAH